MRNQQNTAIQFTELASVVFQFAPAEPIRERMQELFAQASGFLRRLGTNSADKNSEQQGHFFAFPQSCMTSNDVTRSEDVLSQLMENAPESVYRRKNRPHESARQHTKRVADLSRQLGRFIYEEPELNQLTVKANGHDWKEDGGATDELIIGMFGNDVANSIDRLTTPEVKFLALKYRAITSAYLPDERLRKHNPDSIAVVLEAMKGRNKKLYKQMRAKLEKQHKLDAFKTYQPDDVIIKIADNGDSLSSDAEDIKEGRIWVTTNKHQPIPKGVLKVLTPDDVERKIQDRLDLHIALMARLQELKKTGHPALKSPGFHNLSLQLDQYFDGVVANLRDASTIQRPRPSLHQPNFTSLISAAA